MKKTLAIILSVVMMFALPSICLLAMSGNQTEFEVESVNAEAGSTVDVNVSINNNPGIIGAILRLEYSEGLTLKNAVCGEAFSALEMTKPGKFQSPCQFTWDAVDIDPQDIKDGVVLKLTFEVPQNAQLGTQYDVNISGNQGGVINTDLESVDTVFTSGNITVAEPVVEPVDPTVISCQTVDATPGSTVDYNISIHNNPGIIGAIIKVTYDSDLVLTNAVCGDAFSALEMMKPGKFQSPCQFTWDCVDIDEEDIKDGTILTLTFEIPANAVVGTEYDISLSSVEGGFIDSNLSQISVGFENGKINVENAECQHNYELVFSQEPDCETSGLYIYECSECGDSYIEEPDALGHQIAIDSGYAATCQSEGLTDGQHCERCGKVLVVQQTIPKSDHSYALVFSQEPDCENFGLYIYECQYCEESYIEEPDALGHQIAIDPGVEATCQNEGLTEGQHCERCGAVLVEQQVIPKTDHNYEFYRDTTTCEKDGYVIYRCSMCKNFKNVRTSAYGHNYAIASFSNNTIHAECQRNGCGKTAEYDFFDMVGSETGDSNYNEIADLNNDGIINGRDLAILKTR